MTLVATDLDGTLVRSDGTVGERTVRALAAAEDAGIAVVFVTGRPLRWTREVFDHVGAHGLAIVSNGGMVWDVAADRMRMLRAIEPAVGLDVAARIRAAVPGTAFAVETPASGIALEPAFLERHPIPDGAQRGTIEELFTGPAVKLLARHEELPAQEFWDRAEAVVEGLVTITWSSTSSLLEISAAGVTKATTLELVCRELGVDRTEVVALGDMPNDIALLQWAGTSYAMANAHRSVLAVADRVAASNDEEGVAQVLESLVGGAA